MVTGHRRHALLAALAVAALSIPSPAARALDIQVYVRIDPRPALVDRPVELTIEVESGGLGFLRAGATFDLENLEIFDGPFRSERLRFSLGEAQRAATLVWRLRPLAPGSAAVRNLEVEIRGQRLALPDQTLQVLDAPAGPDWPPPREQAHDPFADLFERFRPGRRRAEPRRLDEPRVFLQAQVKPRQPYVGQQTRYSLYLYTQADVESIHPQRVPDFQGFWVASEQEGEKRETEMVEIDGERFARAKLLERVLYPLRPGSFELDVAEVDLVIRRPYMAAPGSLFSRPERLRRRSELLHVDVRALPAAPDGFSGAVGRLELQARLEPEQVRVGEAAVLTLTLSGPGNLQALPQPSLPRLPGFAVYPPQETFRQQWQGTQLSGVREWQFILIPEWPQRWELPAVEIQYFDPEDGSFRLASTGALQMAAYPGPVAGDSVVHPARPHPVRSAAVPAARASDLTRVRMLLFALPWGVAVVLMLLRRRQPTAPATVVAFEQAMRGLPAGDSPRRAARRVESAWRLLLKESWGVQPGLAASRWPDELLRRGAGREEAEELRELVGELQDLRLLPELAAAEGLLRSLVERSLTLGSQLVARAPRPPASTGDGSAAGR